MKQEELMTEGVKLPYEAPQAQSLSLSRRMSLLESFSAEADFGEFEDGGEL